MGIQRSRRTGRAVAEQLLAGDPAVSGDLSDLLTAAASSVPTGAVAGEDAATAAFRAARHEPVRHRLTRRPAITKMLTAKIAVLAAVLIGAGGVAVAATTGVLPNPLRTHPTSTPGPGRMTERPTPAPSPTPSGQSGQSGHPSSGPATSPAADLHRLCGAHATQLAAGHGNVLGTPAFAALVAAAGGKSQVAAYCAALDATPSASTKPGHSGAAPTSHPTGKPGNAPAGGSTTHPTGRPTSHPGKAPSTPPGH